MRKEHIMSADYIMDVRSNGLDDSLVFREISERPVNPAWPAWKQLLEDLAEAPMQLDASIKLGHKTLGDAGAFRLAELLRGRLSSIHTLDLRFFAKA
jgi:hypothetical protein